MPLEFSEQYTVDKPRSQIARIAKEYFSRSRFRLAAETDSTLHFARGSRYLNFITFNPLQWRSAINVQIGDGRPARVDCEARISTVGQLVTKREKAVWSGFLENLGQTLATGTDFSAKNRLLVRRAQRSNLLTLVICAGIALVAGFIIFRIFIG